MHIEATARAEHRGHPIVFIDGTWVYEDNLRPIPSYGGEDRPCAKCGELPIDGLYDSCIGKLPGVKNACCGHGNTGRAYIQFENGTTVRGFDHIDLPDDVHT